MDIGLVPARQATFTWGSFVEIVNRRRRGSAASSADTPSARASSRTTRSLPEFGGSVTVANPCASVQTSPL